MWRNFIARLLGDSFAVIAAFFVPYNYRLDNLIAN
jgi:hypothetical protein